MVLALKKLFHGDRTLEVTQEPSSILYLIQTVVLLVQTIEISAFYVQ